VAGGVGLKVGYYRAAVRLDGEIALVTGSTAGIGRAIAVEFARQGARVAITGRDETRGRAVVETIASGTDGDTSEGLAGGAGSRAVFVSADLASEDDCDGLVAAVVEHFGGVTVLVNNAAAGGARDGAVGVLDTAAWEAVLRVNLTAPMWLCRAAIPHMLAAGHGAIVNISSRQGERASPGLAAYCASKGGLNALTRSLAVDYASEGIRANTISPGYVRNDRRDADLSVERRARLEAMHLTRLGEAADVAHAAVYLASREAEFLTGVNLALDGGSSAARGLVLG
jgi:meso-butanediol dehydrogenase / (S,S)-butanediol dehydrogenase / diacetyl reductase